MTFEFKIMQFSQVFTLQMMTTVKFSRCSFNYMLIGNKNKPHLGKHHLNEYQCCVSSGAFLGEFL